MSQLVQDCFSYKIFVQKPSKAHKDWFKRAFDVEYPSDYNNIDPRLAKELQKIVKMRKRDAEFEKRMSQQRSRRGYADVDVWNIDWWFIRTCKPMLVQLAKNHHGFPSFLDYEWFQEHPELNMTYDEWVCWPSDEESEGYKLRQKANEECDQRWTDILNNLVRLLSEMNEETCSIKNIYEKQWWNYHKKFDKKYESTDELKTEEEKEFEQRTHTFVHIGPERDPEFGEAYSEVLNKFLEYDKQIADYRNQCKNEFFELFSKYFWSLGD